MEWPQLAVIVAATQGMDFLVNCNEYAAAVVLTIVMIPQRQFNMPIFGRRRRSSIVVPPRDARTL
jgi:hypothetical protein